MCKVINLMDYKRLEVPHVDQVATYVDYLNLVKEIEELKFYIMMDWTYSVAYRQNNSKESYRRTKKLGKINQRKLIKLKKKLIEITKAC